MFTTQGLSVRLSVALSLLSPSATGGGGGGGGDEALVVVYTVTNVRPQPCVLHRGNNLDTHSSIHPFIHASIICSSTIYSLT